MGKQNQTRFGYHLLIGILSAAFRCQRGNGDGVGVKACDIV